MILMGTIRLWFILEAQFHSKGSGHCLLNIRFDEYRVTSHLAATQATKRYELKATKWALDTYGWDKQIMNISQYVLYSYSPRGTEIARTESQWPYLPKPKLELTPGACVEAFLFYGQFM